MTSVHFVIVSSQEDLSYNFGKMTSNEVDQELTALRAFSEEKLRKGSVVYDKVQDLISQATRENARHAAAVLGVGKIASDGITLVLRFNNTNLRELKSIQVSPDATLAVVKQQIEAITGPAYCAERIQVRRTGKAFGQFDEKTIVQCEIKHNDELVVECKNINENFNPTGMERVTASGVTFSSEFQLICLALHAFMLDEGYVAVLELPNAVPGFAPSLKGERMHYIHDYSTDSTSSIYRYLKSCYSCRVTKGYFHRKQLERRSEWRSDHNVQAQAEAWQTVPAHGMLINMTYPAEEDTSQTQFYKRLLPTKPGCESWR